MLLPRLKVVTAVQSALLVGLFLWTAGCQTGPQVSSRRLIEHQAMIDFAGLNNDAPVASVKTVLGTPRKWEIMPTDRTALYTHQQWRSPSTHTGIGVLYAHLPLPLSAKTVVWLAKQEYSKSQHNGKIVNEWTDGLGRSWFEAENNRYHIRGYVVVNGFDAWVVYFGYRSHYPPDVAEISLAARAAESAVPMQDESAVPTTQPAAGTK
ncbi:MAG TPA: hypothetical protein VLJ39_08940 [Tepidisphaeraceae bacterium]|jgi:hypothetical protein|nr:hypothetical protein [Tepidisphaeraceae bacterium]